MSSGMSGDQELGWLMVTHFLKHKELADVLLSRGRQLPYELGPQHGVWVSFGQRGDDILYSCGIPVVQLRDYVEVLGLLASDVGQENCALAWANHTARRSAQNSRSCTATLDNSAGGEGSAVYTLRRGHQWGMSILAETTT
jgi:hypothetical protein